MQPMSAYVSLCVYGTHLRTYIGWSHLQQPIYMTGILATDWYGIHVYVRM